MPWLQAHLVSIICRFFCAIPSYALGKNTIFLIKFKPFTHIKQYIFDLRYIVWWLEFDLSLINSMLHKLQLSNSVFFLKFSSQSKSSIDSFQFLYFLFALHLSLWLKYASLIYFIIGNSWSQEEKCCIAYATVCWGGKEWFAGLLEISKTGRGMQFPEKLIRKCKVLWI